MIIANMAEAEAALRPFVPLVKELTGTDTTLERIGPLMDLLGNPQNAMRIIHLAGTSGKTSTAYYIAGLVSAAGHKTGLAVSPHIDSVTERVQLNGIPISEQRFCEQLGIFLDIVARAPQPPSYFELLYAFAIWVFAREQVDYAVIETGMGGLHDATNVATSPDKVCVITDIGFDHTHILGNSLAEIATQKIGIVHPENTVLMYPQTDEVMEVVVAHVAANHAALLVADHLRLMHEHGTFIAHLPAYQQRNLLLACAVYEYVQHRDGGPALDQQMIAQALQIQVPARMDIRQIAGKTIVMDGAHNQQKMSTFIESFKILFPGVKPAILLSLKNGKEYHQIAPLLSGLASHCIVTTFEQSQDLPVRSMSPGTLAAELETAGVTTEVIADAHDAYQALLKTSASVAVITGSFYLLSQIRNTEHLV